MSRPTSPGSALRHVLDVFKKNGVGAGEMLHINALRSQLPLHLDGAEREAGIHEGVRLGYLRVEEQAVPRIFLTEQGFEAL